MSVSGVSSTNFFDQSVQSMQVKAQKIQSEFQKLGQDLQAGNLTQAQSDFSILNSNISTPMQTTSSLSQDFGALGTALQAGDLTAAQKAYSAVQQDVQTTSQSHRHHTMGGSSSNTSTSGNALSQLLSNLGSSIQSGSSAAAQTAYSTLAGKLQQFGLGAGSSLTSSLGALSLLA